MNAHPRGITPQEPAAAACRTQRAKKAWGRLDIDERRSNLARNGEIAGVGIRRHVAPIAEGVFEAMGNGEVDPDRAKDHRSLWVRRRSGAAATRRRHTARCAGD